MVRDDRHRLASRTIAEYGGDIAKIMGGLSSKSRLLILSNLLGSPASFAQLRSATGLSKTALAHHLNNLVENHLVDHPSRGRYEISADGAEILQTLATVYAHSSRALGYESGRRREHIEKRHMLKEAVDAFQNITSRVASHTEWGDGVYPYPQPCMYLVAHLVCMQTASWTNQPKSRQSRESRESRESRQPEQSRGSLYAVDFDMLAAVSGASALFAYQPGTYTPKYANSAIGMDDRIEKATGFGFEWVRFDDAEAAWRILGSSIDSGRPTTGWYYENMVFAGYQDAERAGERKVFAMTDGPEYFAKWWSWEEFSDWVADWSRGKMGRHTRRVRKTSARETALRVMRDLVGWSTDTPASITSGPMWTGAKFGLRGMEAYADDCRDVERFGDWLMCHDVNPQWSLRNSTSVYLHRVADAKIFPTRVTLHIREAAKKYRAAFDQWHLAERQLGHSASEEQRRSVDTRRTCAAMIQSAVKHEESALNQIQEALKLAD